LLFRWARLEILAGLLQEVLLISLSLSIIVDAINKLINPNHIEDAPVMIFFGSVGAFIGLLGLFLFRSYDHDHNIGNEIVEQKKHDFVRSVYTTLRNLDINNEHTEHPLIEQSSISPTQPINIPELVVTESTSNTTTNNNNEQKKTHQSKQDLILPSLNDTYKNAFIVSETTTNQTKEERFSDSSEKQLRVPDRISVEFTRMRSKSGDSMMSSTFALNQDYAALDDEFQKSRVYATLHALCLHSLVNIYMRHRKKKIGCSLK
jgi:Co/Zn/Cd efflux system component